MELGDEADHTKFRQQLIEVRFELMRGVLHSMGHSVSDLTATAARAKLVLSTVGLKKGATEGGDRDRLHGILSDMDDIATRLAADFQAMRSLVTFEVELPDGRLSEVLKEVTRSLSDFAARRRVEISLRLEGDGSCIRGPMKLALFSLMLAILRSGIRSSRSKVTITLARGPVRQQAQVRIEHPFEELAAHLATLEEGVPNSGIPFDIFVARRSIEVIGGELKAEGYPGRSSFTITIPLREE